MRISDWSSDVCSSDLKLRPATKATYARDLRTTFGDYLDRPLVDLTPERVRDRHKDRKSRPIRAQARVEHARDRKRSEESRVGKECVRTCKSRRATQH